MSLPDAATVSRELCAARDAADPLSPCRALFELPDDVLYLDGNSLGALPKAVRARVAETVDVAWGRDLIRSWNSAGWVDLPTTIGSKIAPLIGADEAGVVVADSTSVNLFKVLAAALALRPGRGVIVSERSNFPTDLYIAEGLSALAGQGHRLVLIDDAEAIGQALGPDVAVLMLTHVNYRTGRMHDMAALTGAAHAAGSLVVWDLAHSAGAVPVDLCGANADFAVGCGYKFLNGGPGAPAFLYVAPAHRAAFSQPLSGWFGHAAPFSFEPGYRPAEGVARYLCGTPPVLSAVALDAALDLWAGIDIGAVRAKSLALTDLFIDLVETRCAGQGLRLVTPRSHDLRGSQVSFSHDAGYPVMQALIARGVIGDFRAPDILRFGFAPLYTRFVDVWDAVEALTKVLETRAWDRPEFHRRAAVT